jgi:hypothetical protein
MGAPNEIAQRLAVALAQGGEFAFVLFATAAALGVLDARTSELLVVVVTISLLLAPLAFVAHDKLLARWQERRTEPEYDVIDAPATPVVIAGYGRYGQIVSRVLRIATSRSPPSKSITSKSISCGASATRFISAMRRASTCCRR